jgi:hypothetical protein
MNLGRYPFEAAANDFMNGRHGTVATSTESEERRKYRYLGKVFQELKSSGNIKSTNPQKMGRTGAGIHGLDEGEAYRCYSSSSLPEAPEQPFKGNKNYIIEEMKTDGVRSPSLGRSP